MVLVQDQVESPEWGNPEAGSPEAGNPEAGSQERSREGNPEQGHPGLCMAEDDRSSSPPRTSHLEERTTDNALSVAGFYTAQRHIASQTKAQHLLLTLSVL